MTYDTTNIFIFTNCECTVHNILLFILTFQMLCLCFWKWIISLPNWAYYLAFQAHCEHKVCAFCKFNCSKCNLFISRCFMLFYFSFQVYFHSCGVCDNNCVVMAELSGTFKIVRSFKKQSCTPFWSCYMVNTDNTLRMRILSDVQLNTAAHYNTHHMKHFLQKIIMSSVFISCESTPFR